MSVFIGRDEQLASLGRHLAAVRAEGPRPGRALLVRGRRRVGKSRLVEEFIERSGVPHVYFTASRQPSAEELRLFAAEVAASDLPGAATFAAVTPSTWEAALTLLATTVPTDAPSIIVIDELPYLTGDDAAFEGTLQKVFDRVLTRLPVLLIGVGSDLAMMEALNAYGRPFHQRAQEMVVPPLSPLDVQRMLDLEPADAFDAHLLTGGLPLICQEWSPGLSMWAYLEQALAQSTSALLVSAERALAAEFPTEAQARRVLSTVGAGERTFSTIARKAGGLPQASLSRSLTQLRAKRVVAADTPLSTRPSRETRYRVADPYLRFWLSFLGPHLAEIERGRGDRVLARIRSSWSSWRGRAVEPVVRESLMRLPADARGGADGIVGGYWTRTNDPEIDLVIADREPVATRIEAVGSIKWLDGQPFDSNDLGALVTHRGQLPGAAADTPLVVVSRTGSSVSGPTVIGPEQLLAGWRRL
ncbi:AAA family ATPase [Modestobacter sp. I12A-02628]|uniref:AAA family ATPase n=1 Tax=Goekera deserti TaxID=2497753 RepID=A0A7K3WAN9_9ACTN|nr:AAA family ATPase [Goekera deserti]MPQ99774.1 AAA family ATPase [Goekera deserti]NDI49533.1 AAA family ATPase [Goekera deserti]NEL52593.1 AAA family ATPase [Goekera deserti]